MGNVTSTASIPGVPARVLAMLALVVAWSCAKDSAPHQGPVVVTEAPAPTDAPEASGAMLAPAWFVRAPANLGLDFVHAAEVDGDKAIGSSVVLFDANNDARLDLYLTDGAPASARGAASAPAGRLYMMEGERFVERTVEAGLALPSLAGRELGARAVDCDGDGDWDLWLSYSGQVRLMRNEGGRFTQESATVTFDVPWDADEYRAIGSAGDGASTTDATSLARARSTCDANLDGIGDLLTLDGALDAAEERDARSAGQRRRPRLYLGTGAPDEYRDASASSGPVFEAPIAGGGLALGDLDGDSDVDVVIVEQGGPAHVWLNDNPSGHRPLRLVLLGKAPNTYALGAEVEVSSAATDRPQRVRLGRRYLSHHEHTLTFGIGVHTSTDVTVRWPDGRTSEHKDLAPGRTHVLH